MAALLIPLVSTRRGDHAAAGRASQGRQATRLAAPPHRRQGQPRLDALGRSASRRRRWLAAGTGAVHRRRARARRHAAAARRCPTPTRSPSCGDAKQGLAALERAGIGDGRAAAPRDPGRRRQRSATGGGRAATASGHPRRGRSRQQRVAARRYRDRRSHSDRRQRHRRKARRPSSTSATRLTPPARTCASAASRPERRLHRRRLRQLPADVRADRDHHLHPARARLPLAAAAAKAVVLNVAQRRRRLGRAGAGLAGGLRSERDLGHPRRPARSPPGSR